MNRIKSLLLSGAAALSLFVLPSAAPAQVTFVVQYGDSAGEGFNDATLGATRRTAFEYALDLWAQRLDSDVTIRVRAEFNALGGSAGGAVLGSAGPASFFQNFPNAPVANTFYGSALADALRGADNSVGQIDIDCQFNSDVDGPVVFGPTSWTYTLSEGGAINFVHVVLHELGHGLNFVDGLNTNGSFSFGNPSIYDRFLTQPGVGDLTALSQAQRANAIISQALFFEGPSVLSTVASPFGARMYAPNPFEGGSSVSHFDTSFNPDELMEPEATGGHDLGRTINLFEDLGWTIVAEPTAADEGWNLYE